MSHIFQFSVLGVVGQVEQLAWQHVVDGVEGAVGQRFLLQIMKESVFHSGCGFIVIKTAYPPELVTLQLDG